MKFMFCPKCGTYNENGNFLCIKCGYDFNNVPDSVKSSGQIFQSEAENNGAKPHIDADVSGGACESSVKNVKRNSKHPKDYFVQAILSAILCSIAFGAAAVIFSGMTQTERAVGNVVKAENYSEKTKMFCWIALAVGIVKYIFIILFVSSGWLLF